MIAIEDPEQRTRDLWSESFAKVRFLVSLLRKLCKGINT